VSLGQTDHNAEDNNENADHLLSIDRCVFSEATLSGCFKETRGFFYWTAGQRIDPARNSEIIWRVTSTNTYSDTMSAMTFSNWDQGQPNWHSSVEACIGFMSGRSYTWNDLNCATKLCSVCELDISP